MMPAAERSWIAALPTTALLLMPAAPASAQDYYAGGLLSTGSLAVDYDKTVIVRGGAPVANPPGLGGVRSSPSSSSGVGVITGLGVLDGVRFSLGRAFADVEADVSTHLGAAEGYLPGTGTQRGENWPEQWRVTQRWSLRGTARLGVLMSRSRLYAMIGQRYTRFDFSASFTGCELPWCEPGEFVTGELQRSNRRGGVVAGVGLEFPLRPRTALRIEAYATKPGADHTVTDFDENDAGMPTISVPSTLGGDEIGLVFAVMRRF